MKANELMLGDWVVYRGDTEYTNPVRIEGMDILIGALITEDRDDVGFDGIEPIPITAEILEKNGFKDRWYEELVLEADEYCFALQKGVDGINAWWWEMFSSPIIPINHVHELQHALRLCKIEKEIEI